MYGWLLGTAGRRILLVKIIFNNTKAKVQGDILVNKNNATYYTNEFKIIEIVDEFLTNYISVDISKIINEKMCKIQNFKINELYEDSGIFFYMHTQRALYDIYLINSTSTGIFKQYSLSGSLQGEITMFNGRMNGAHKIYNNGELIEETEYKNDKKNGLCKIYKDKGTITEFKLWKNGSLINH